MLVLPAKVMKKQVFLPLFPLPPRNVFWPFPFFNQGGQPSPPLCQANDLKVCKICLYTRKSLLWQLKLVSGISIFYQNKNLTNYQKCFSLYKKGSFFPQNFQSFVLLYSSLFFFLGHCWFYRRSWLEHHYDPELDFKITFLFISGEVKLSSWCFVK